MHNLITQFQKKYPFPLDKFQIDACECLIKGESVLVTAPTGSGKTLIAEFTVFDSLDRNLKTIYTTPLKALSNQKFRDLCEEYGTASVGLLTGDTSVNPDAPIIVMTTEILRNILYQDIRRLDDVMYVVLDECHYMNDRDRGTVWEEILIHCPRHILFVALSATIANAKDLAAWISSIHNDVVVIEHPERPVPIDYIYYTNQKLYPLLNSEGGANQKLMRSGDTFGGHRRTRAQEGINPVNVLSKLHEKNLLPAIYFIFSRKSCDLNLTDCLDQKIKLTSKEEKAAILEVVNKVAKDNPSLVDTSPITRKLLRALPEGIAVHHAGLVPILRHLVEILFQKNLIKVVFATETLAAGINMPARTSVISTLSKRGDFGHEILSANSFMQMTGRAGRRGKDKIGFCVVVNDQREPYSEAFRLVKAPPDPIVSNFTLSYNMILNLLKNFRMEDIKDILKRSFGQYLSNRDIIDLRVELERQQKQIGASMVPCTYKPDLKVDEMPLLDYEALRSNIETQELKIREAQEQFEDKNSQKVSDELEHAKRNTIIVFKANDDKPILGSMIVKYKEKTRHYEKPVFFLIVMTDKGVTKISPSQCLYVSKNVKSASLPEHVLADAYNIKTGQWLRMKNAKKLFDNSENKKYLNLLEAPEYPRSLLNDIDKLDELRLQLRKHECQLCPILNEHLHQHKKLKNITQDITDIKNSIAHQQELYIHDFKKFMNVLERYEQIEQDSTGEFKPSENGLVTSYIRAENELAISLLVSRGIFSDLDSIEIAAVLSTLVYEPRRTSVGLMDSVSRKVKNKIKDVEKIISELQHIQNIEGVHKEVNVEPDIVHTVIAWGSGSTWKALVQNSHLDDGDIIRSMRRIIDLLHQLKNIPEIDRSLKLRLTEAISLIDRDLITVNIDEESIEEVKVDESIPNIEEELELQQ
ncbi:MAG: DEAD/DEAH box helicase [Candidatus Sericytochromatia bacterium]|nr:DEAD/DEAH box helicase [Candidatus Sericytochromatia bacterium]